MEFKCNDHEKSQQGGMFFSDEEEDEDIVAKIHHFQQNIDKATNKKPPQKRRDLQDLFSQPVKKDDSPSNLIDTTSRVTPTGEVQLSRLLDDYMLGEKGDQIIQQMEDLTTDDPPPPAQEQKSESQRKRQLGGVNELNTDHYEPSLAFDTMVSMEDFEKYIAEN